MQSELRLALTARCKDMGNTLCIDMGNSFHFTSGAFHGHVVERNLLCSAAAGICEVGFEGPQRHVAIVSEVRNQSQKRLQMEGTLRAGRSPRFVSALSTRCICSCPPFCSGWPGAMNSTRSLRAQQRRLNRWVRVYNQIRPHQALGQRPPAELYQPRRWIPRAVQLKYPKRWSVRRVRSNGEIKWLGRKRFVGEAFVGHAVGLKSKGAGKFAVYFIEVLIGELWECDQKGMRPAKYVRRF